jgi:lipoprotein-releasing system permease protein
VTALATETAAPATAPATRPCSAFEWMVAFRYQRARKAPRSISVNAGFYFLGIVLGVAALIVVMAVMNGFRHDLME